MASISRATRPATFTSSRVAAASVALGSVPMAHLLSSMHLLVVHSLVHSLKHAAISFMHAFILPCIHSSIQPFAQSFDHSFVRSLVRSFVCSFIHICIVISLSLSLSLILSFHHSFILSSFCSFVYSLIHPFICSHLRTLLPALCQVNTGCSHASARLRFCHSPRHTPELLMMCADLTTVACEHTTCAHMSCHGIKKQPHSEVQRQVKGPEHADQCAKSAHSEQFCLHDTNPMAIGQDNRRAHIATQIRRLSHQLKVSKPAAGILAELWEHSDARHQKDQSSCAERWI